MTAAIDLERPDSAPVRIFARDVAGLCLAFDGLRAQLEATKMRKAAGRATREELNTAEAALAAVEVLLGRAVHALDHVGRAILVEGCAHCDFERAYHARGHLLHAAGTPTIFAVGCEVCDVARGLSHAPALPVWKPYAVAA